MCFFLSYLSANELHFVLMITFSFHFTDNVFSCHADGQAIAKKLSKMITQATVTLNKLLTKSNALLSGVSSEISFEEAKNPLSTLYGDSTVRTEIPACLPSPLKRKLIDTYCLCERCSEELSFLSEEVQRLKSFYESQISVIDDVIQRTTDLGIHSLLLKKKTVHSRELYNLKLFLSELFPAIDFSECLKPQTCEVLTDGTCIYPGLTDLTPTFTEYDTSESESELSSEEDD